LPTAPDTYCLVFDNGFALIIPRAVQANATVTYLQLANSWSKSNFEEGVWEHSKISIISILSEIQAQRSRPAGLQHRDDPRVLLGVMQTAIRQHQIELTREEVQRIYDLFAQEAQGVSQPI
jgi:hypothetical protein